MYRVRAHTNRNTTIEIEMVVDAWPVIVVAGRLIVSFVFVGIWLCWVLPRGIFGGGSVGVVVSSFVTAVAESFAAGVFWLLLWWLLSFSGVFLEESIWKFPAFFSWIWTDLSLLFSFDVSLSISLVPGWSTPSSTPDGELYCPSTELYDANECK